jgi:hypothetical protein
MKPVGLETKLSWFAVFLSVFGSVVLASLARSINIPQSFCYAVASISTIVIYGVGREIIKAYKKGELR